MGDKQFVALPNVLYIIILGSFHFEAYFASAIFILQNGIQSHILGIDKIVEKLFSNVFQIHMHRRQFRKKCNW